MEKVAVLDESGGNKLCPIYAYTRAHTERYHWKEAKNCIAHQEDSENWYMGGEKEEEGGSIQFKKKTSKLEKP